MQFSFKITVGTTEFTIQETATNHLEFFKKASFFTTLPTVGPNQETDLELRARTTQKGVYYSIVSPSAKKEFKLGVSQKEAGTLFPKGWDDLYVGNNNNDNEEGNDQEEVSKPANVGRGLGANKVATPPKQQVPYQAEAEEEVSGEEVPEAAPVPRSSGLGRPNLGLSNVKGAVNNAPKATVTPPVSAAGNKAVNEVLAKYGFKK